MNRRLLLVVLAIVSALLAGCASVPANSPVQVLRQVNGSEVAPPSAPVAGSDPTELVRDFVTASASSADKHGVARQYLTPEAAAGWDDGASLTVLETFSTVPTARGPANPDTTSIRVSAEKKIGTLDAGGAFRPDESPFSIDVDLVRLDGQWRIARLPNGVVIEQSAFVGNYRKVSVWFVDPSRRLAVPDQRYIAGEPPSTQPARLMQLLFDGPERSPVLDGAATTQFPPGAQMRSNVVIGADNTVVVDLTGLGTLDDPSRQLLAAQVVLTLTGVVNSRIDLRVDNEPLVPGRPLWTRQDVASSIAEATVSADAPALVASGGRVGKLSGSTPLTPLPGPAGDGRIDARSAAVSADGVQLAVVARDGTGVGLLVGTALDGALGSAVLGATSMTRPTWTPIGDEVWTIADASRIVRVRRDGTGRTTVGDVANDLQTRGPITELRLSRDGMRVLAVVGGGLYVGAVVRSLDGVAIRDVRRLRPETLAAVTAADWLATDSILVATTAPQFLVANVDSDGLALYPYPTNNLQPAVTAVAAVSTDRLLLVTDPSGVWSFSTGKQEAWRVVSGGTAGAVPGYPG